MVYNGTSSGINDALWYTNFALTTESKNLRDIEEGAFMYGRYVREMFLNLILGKKVMPYCGVDITHMRSEDHQEWDESRQYTWET